MSVGDFGINIQNKFLQGAVLSIFNGIPEKDCTRECLMNNHCKSINFDNGNKECQLNSKIAGDSGTNLITNNRWEYKSTNYSLKKVRFFSSKCSNDYKYEIHRLWI